MTQCESIQLVSLWNYWTKHILRTHTRTRHPHTYSYTLKYWYKTSALLRTACTHTYFSLGFVKTNSRNIHTRNCSLLYISWTNTHSHATTPTFIRTFAFSHKSLVFCVFSLPPFDVLLSPFFSISAIFYFKLNTYITHLYIHPGLVMISICYVLYIMLINIVMYRFEYILVYIYYCVQSVVRMCFDLRSTCILLCIIIESRPNFEVVQAPHHSPSCIPYYWCGGPISTCSGDPIIMMFKFLYMYILF